MENMKLQILQNQKERLIAMNEKANYTQSGNAKIEKYIRLLLSVKKEINDIQIANILVRKSKVVSSVRRGMFAPTETLTVAKLYEITKPPIY